MASCPADKYPDSSTECVACAGTCLSLLASPALRTFTEPVAVGTAVARAVVTDKRLLSRALAYSLGGTDSADFAINASGFVSVARTLDREWVAAYDLLVHVTDNGADLSSALRASATLAVSLTDINDNAPVLTPLFSQFTVPENQPAGHRVTTLSASDLDTGFNAFLEYSLVAGDDGNDFAVSVAGVVATRRPLDHETTPSYDLTVSVCNPVVPRLCSNGTVRVLVGDANDNAPVFEAHMNPVMVAESAIVGSQVLQLSARDADGPGVNSQLTYVISTGNTDNVFSVDRTSGLVRLAKLVDYETRTAYKLVLLAMDSGVPVQLGNTTLDVNVQDVNDNSPVFQQTVTSLTVAESTAANTVIRTITATDADSGTFGQLTYTLSGSGSERFRVSSRGAVSLAMTLDYEQRMNYVLILTASDGGSPPKTATSELRIAVTNVNDQAPVLNQTMYVLYIAEDQVVNTDVGLVIADDPDKLPLTYALASASVPSVFAVQSATGSIVLAASLDFETTQRYALNVSVSDGAFIAYAQVVVNVLDVNDNNPVPDQAMYTLSVPENTSVPTSLLTVSSTDADSGVNRVVRYTIATSSAVGVFTIDAISGVLTLAQSLDYEAESRYTLNISLSNSLAAVQRTSFAQVSISVLDNNDNAPMFVSPQGGYQVSISESISPGASVFTVTADDADSTTNAELRYQLNPSVSAFRIAATSGLITVARSLDRETQKSYTVPLLVHDLGNPELSGNSTILITLLDVNDNAPAFTQTSYNVTVTENTPAGIVSGLDVFAHDPDAGSNGTVSFALLDNLGVFSIEPLLGNLSTLAPLDRESRPSYILTVQAKDGGRPAMSSTVTVFVQVGDVNDNAPQLASPSTSVTFTEAGAAVHLAPQLTVTELDLVDIVSATVTVQLASTNTLTPYQDQLSVATSLVTRLSVALQNSSRVMVISGAGSAAQYGAVLRSVLFRNVENEPTADTRQVIMQVNDGLASVPLVIRVNINLINDNPPRVSLSAASPAFASVSFTEGTGSIPVLAATALSLSDPDSGAVNLASVYVSLIGMRDGIEENITASMANGLVISSSADSLVLTGPASFAVFTTALLSLTYFNSAEEPNPATRSVVIVANDGLHNSTAVTVRINIDLVDDAPNLQLTLNGDIALRYREGSGPVQLSDSGFQLADNDNTSLSSATVTMTGGVDGSQELLTYTVGSGLIRATPSVSAVMFTGVDTISSYSQLLKSLYYTHTGSNPTDGQRIVTFSVSDGVKSSNAVQAFVTISAVNDPPLVDLNGRATGSDVTASFTEGDAALPVCTQARVLDADNTHLVSAHIILTNPLDASSESLSAQAPSSSIIVTQVSAAELHAVGSATLSDYAMLIQSLLYINTAQAPTETQRVITVTVNDSISTSITRSVRIAIIGVDDAPVLVTSSRQPLPVTYTEQSSAVLVVVPGQVRVSDVDNMTLAACTVTVSPVPDGSSEQLQYILPSGITLANMVQNGTMSARYDFSASPMPQSASTFQQLLSSLAFINTAVEPTPEPVRTVRIRVSDGLLESNEQSAHVNVTLINDNPPVFARTSYSLTVAENTEIGFTVDTITATDADSPLGMYAVDGLITYRKVSGDFASLFAINQSTGAIVVAAPLDFEIIFFQPSFTIQATNSLASPALSSPVVTVTVSITDVNDNAPVITSPSVINVTENVALRTVLGFARATDRDSGVNADVRYYIVSSHVPPAPFALGSRSGTLVSTASVDREQQSQYLLTIDVQDRGTPPMQSTQILTVNILDINDNAPRFTQSSYSIDVSEGRSVGDTILQVTATDADFGANGTVQYRLQTPNNYLSLSTSGVLNIRNELDRETAPSISVTAVAYDLGSPSMMSMVTISCTVTDVNDNRPQFANSSYSFSITEDISAGSEVGRALATDIDAGNNGTVIYSVMSGNTAGRFTVDDSGVVTTAGRIDREVASQYNLVIDASDEGQPPMSNVVNVSILITDVNDNAPVFSRPAYQVSVYENISSSMALVQLLATDADVGSNAAIVYSVLSVSSGGRFQLNTTSGQLTVTPPLDREQVDAYHVVVEASDQGHPQQRTSVNVTVDVLDVNDNSPLFSPSLFTFNITENNAGGAAIGTVTADDLDAGSNGRVRYRLVSSAHSSQFVLDPVSGVLRANVAFNREVIPSYLLDVEASDEGSPARTSRTTISVAINDVNDNRPVFTQSSYSASLLENSTSGTLVTVAMASDADSGTNSQVSYTIQPPGALSISDSGVVVLMTRLDAETAMSHVYSIIASDGGSPQNSATATLRLSVLNINDNPPVISPTTLTESFTENGAAVPFARSLTLSDSDVVHQQFTATLTLQRSGTVVVSPYTGLECGHSVLPWNKLAQCNVNASTGNVLSSARLVAGAALTADSATLRLAAQGQSANTAAASIQLTNSFTIGMWIKISSHVTAPLFSLSDGAKQYFSLRIDTPASTMTITYQTAGGAGSSSDTTVTFPAVSLRTNQWQHIAVVMSYPNVFLHVDGATGLLPSATATLSSPLQPLPSNALLHLGSDGLSSGISATFLGELSGFFYAPHAVAAASLACVSSCDEWLVPVANSASSSTRTASRSSAGGTVEYVDSTLVGIQTAIRSTGYYNAQAEPDLATRRIQIQLYDGRFYSPMAVASVQIVAVNDRRPVIDLDSTDGNASLNFATLYIENHGPVRATSASVKISDSDFGVLRIDHVNVSVVLPRDGTNEKLSATASGQVSIIQTSASSLWLVGPALFADFEQVLQTVQYDNTAIEPSMPAVREISFSASDGTLLSPAVSTIVTIMHTNDPPVLQLSGENNLTFTEGSPPLLLLPTGLSLTDSDNTTALSVTISLQTSPDGAMELLNVSANRPGIRVQYGTNTLSLVGPALRSDFVDVLKTLTYQHTNDAMPTAGVRAVLIIASDGLAISSILVFVTVRSLNDAPLLDISGLGVTRRYLVSFTEGDSGVAVVSSKLSLQDVDSVNMTQATFSLSPRPNGATEGLRMNISNSALTFNYDMTRGTLSILGQAHVDQYAVAMKTIVYYNSNENPDTTLRRVIMHVFDDKGTSSNSAEALITVIAVNDPPEIQPAGLFPFAVTFVEEKGPVVILPTGVSAYDADSPGIATVFVQVTGVEDGVSEVLIASDPAVRATTTNTARSISGLSVQYTFSPSLPLSSASKFLQGLHYNNLALEPSSLLPRQVQVSMSDGLVMSRLQQSTITVVPVNDHLPMFTRTVFTGLAVDENARVGHSVVQVSASDGDGDNVVYSINSSVPFQVSSTGIVSVSGPLDRETTTQYSFFVHATEMASPSRQAVTPAFIDIAILDINDNFPRFVPALSTVNVSEASPVGTLVTLVFAQDTDNGSNGTLLYSILSGNDNASFEIDPATGAVRVSNGLDRETRARFTLLVQARDAGTPAHDRSESLLIDILDVNDSPPRFSAPLYHVSVSEVSVQWLCVLAQHHCSALFTHIL